MQLLLAANAKRCTVSAKFISPNLPTPAGTNGTFSKSWDETETIIVGPQKAGFALLFK
jgi:hypothetical protein